MKCKRCHKIDINTFRSVSLCTYCLDSAIVRSKKSRIKTNSIDRRKELGKISVSKGLCQACFTKPIFSAHSKKFCEHCFSNRKKSNLKYRSNNKDLEVFRIRRWQSQNPDKLSAYGHKRRSLKINAEGNFSGKEWRDLKEKYNNTCLWCGNKIKLTADHVIPLIRGGTNWISNIQPLCKSCNSKKGTKIIDFRQFGNAIMEWT